MKRSIILILASCLLTAVLSGCGGNNRDSGGQATSSSNDGKKPVTIVTWTGSEYAKDEFADQSGKRFHEKYPWINVKTIIHDGDRVTDFITAAAAGNAPDEVAISFPMLSKLVFNGLISPIDEYWNSWEEAKNFDPMIINNCKVNGKLYGIPGESYLMGIVYNKKLFEEAGIEHPPTTWQEVIDFSKRLTSPLKQQVGFGLLTGEWVDWWFEYFVWQAGGDLTKQNPDGTVTCTFTDPAVIKAAEFYRQLKKEKVIQPDLTMNHSTLMNTFAMGKIGMTIATIGDIGTFTSMGMKKEDIGYALFPKGPSGQNPSQFGGNLFGLNAKSPKEVKDAVFLHIAHQYSKDETVAKLKFDEERGKASLRLLTRNDINQLDIQPSLANEKDFLNVLDHARMNLRLEFYAKGSVGKYIDAAIQKIVADDSVDIRSELQKAQALAEKEGAKDFNDAMKK